VAVAPTRVQSSPSQQTAPLDTFTHSVPAARHIGHSLSHTVEPSLAHMQAIVAPPGQLYERHVVFAAHPRPSGSVHAEGGGVAISSVNASAASSETASPMPVDDSHDPLHTRCPSLRHVQDTVDPDGQVRVVHVAPTAHGALPGIAHVALASVAASFGAGVGAHAAR
jgi:hypothetical protein